MLGRKTSKVSMAAFVAMFLGLSDVGRGDALVATESRFLSVGGFEQQPASDFPVLPSHVTNSPHWQSGSHVFRSSLVARAAFEGVLASSLDLDDILRHYAGRGTWMHSGVFSALGHFHSGSGAGGTRAMATQVDPGAPKRLVGLLLRGMATEGSPGPGVPLAVAVDP